MRDFWDAVKVGLNAYKKHRQQQQWMGVAEAAVASHTPCTMPDDLKPFNLDADAIMAAHPEIELVPGPPVVVSNERTAEQQSYADVPYYERAAK